MNRTSLTLIAGFALVAALAGGCQSASDGIGRFTGEEGATTGYERVTWDADVGEINPPSPDRRTVYVQFNDATGRDIQMRNELRDELKALGYQIVTNPDSAAYKLQVRITSFDRREAGDRRDGTGQVLQRTGTNTASRAGSAISCGGFIGDVIQGGASILGEKIGNDTTAREWCLVANFTLAEFVPEGVQTDNYSANQNRTGASNGTGNASGYTVGTRNTVDGQSQTMTTLKNHIEYRRTLTASTTKWNMSEQEAYDKLLPRLLKAAANALPSAI
ncbi:MAG: complement resistance protein TraT [Phycisphaerae bacterium]|jgi:hypothetical protein